MPPNVSLEKSLRDIIKMQKGESLRDIIKDWVLHSPFPSFCILISQLSYVKNMTSNGHLKFYYVNGGYCLEVRPL